MTSLFSRFSKIRILALGLGLQSLSACYVFTEKSSGTKTTYSAAAVLGESLGDRAMGPNDAELAALYAVSTTYAPAAVRPDPDLFVRQLLLQNRDPGSTVAREIGRVERYRPMLGGADVIFSVAPQETYDATSLLAELKVAEELCKSLVDPNTWEHPGWSSILPADPIDAPTNLDFLYKKLIGVPTVDPNAITSLRAILDSAKEGGRLTKGSYIPVCATLTIDAEALLL